MDRKNLYQVFSKPILFIGILLLAGGIFSYTRMQTNLFPEVLFPRVTLIADAGQLPVDRMMITITKPLESAVKKVQGVTIVKSSTSRGGATIDIFFEWGMDTYALKTQIESRINEIRNFMPTGVNISVEPMNQSLFPVFGFILKNTSASQVALKDKANLLVRPVFSQVKGISNVVVRGGRSKEYVVIPDAVKMSSLGITPATIMTTFSNNNFVMANGNIAAYNRIYLSLTDTRVKDIDALRQVIVKNDGNRLIHLSDIAQVEIQEQEEFLKVNADGADGVLIDLVKQPGVNLLDFASDAKAKAASIQKLLPPGYILKPYYDQSAFVGDSIHSVIKTIYEGLFLAIVVMIIFLRSWRASLVVMLTIPVTLAFTLLVIWLAGITLNIMSLGAIAASIGLIIDDAIVIIEQIYRTHEEEPGLDRFTVVKQAIKELFPAMIGSSLATIVIHFPFRLMSGMAGSFFKELSDTMQLTMITSFLVTWLLLPVLHLIIGYRQQLKPQHVEIKNLRWLIWLFDKPAIALAFMAMLGGGAWYASGKLQTGFLPDLDEGTIVLDYRAPAGTNIDETDRICKQMDQIILSNPDVETYSRRTGFGMAFRTIPLNWGDYLIQLKKNRKKTTPQVISELRQQIEQAVPFMHIGFGQRISDLLGDLMSTSQPIEVKIFGDDYTQLQQLAGKAENILQQVKGVADIDNGLVTAGPSLVYVCDQEKLNQYKISLTDFQNQLTAYTGGVVLGMNASQALPAAAQAAMTGGLQIGQMQDGEQMRRILLRFTDFRNNTPETLLKQLIFLPDGTTRPLSFFCHTEIVPGEIEQKREDLKSVITLTARLDNRDLGSTVTEIQQRFQSSLPLPQGYNVTFGGAFAEQQQSFRELLMILTLAVLLVSAVLIFLFKEWVASMIIVVISVMGIGGCLLALYFTSTPLNVSSYTGIIMIVGIIAENAIFTVNQFKHNLQQHN
ncbi:efflux RND transporter permease subunit, partial [Chitinophaga sancti]|uniref:efflux RND transporter permease subunit n=1 Tax=Chitinophaga sancti TaxID=1004 RepID=UPI003F793866